VIAGIQQREQLLSCDRHLCVLEIHAISRNYWF
jgi:hypothetical protein